ncbi:MAG: hypothetical protein EA361_04550 [Bacteroidetes bacterium]|nr:MAG: hypothetical protein EA361_04550 [Bacteroidota bacterium]
MKTKIVLITMLAAVLSLPAWAQLGNDNIRFNGFVRNYTGVLTNEAGDLSILQNTFNLNFNSRGDKVAFKVNPYLYHYNDRELELGLREAYMDMYFNNFDLRIGKQQIIWGKAEGVFITDVVAPKDLREFLLPDFDEIRLGITALKLNYYFGNSTLEAVWTPVFTPTQMPESGSIWQPRMDFPAPVSFDYSRSEIDPSMENSEVYLRFSTMASGFDYELVGGYFWYDDPAMHITRHIDPQTQQLASLTLMPEYHRVSMAGGSISTPVGPFLLRAEGAYYSGRYFQTANPMAQGGKLKKDNLHYMAGLDYNLWGITLSAQFIQELILDYEEGMQNDELDNTMTFLAKKDFLRERLWVELFSYIGLNNEDALIRPKVTYNFADGFEVLGGANIFLGDTGRFGQYKDNDMVYVKVKYSF